VSYASADRERARALSEVLAARGWTVWWDRTIPPGRVFDEVIQEEINAAKCVVVLWSPASVKSNWVKTEAAEAAARGILVPVLLQDAALPMEFKRIQAANLAGWDGEQDHPALATLFAAVGRLMAGPEARGIASNLPPPPPGRGRAFLLAGVLVGVAALIGAGTWWLRRSASMEPAPMAAASNAAPTVATAAGTPTPTTAAGPSAPAPPAGAAPASAPVAARRMNLLSPDNGGQIIAAARADWAHLIDGNEDQGVWVDGGEGVFAFKDERPARFDTFAVLVPDTSDVNLKSFELFAADSPTGPFTSIGKFDTQNLRLFKSPYQEFRFQPVTAKYLKLRSLASHRGDNGAVRAYEFQLFGDLQ